MTPAKYPLCSACNADGRFPCVCGVRTQVADLTCPRCGIDTGALPCRLCTDHDAIKLPPKPDTSHLESQILADIRGELARMPDVVLFRNNTGALKDERGRVVRYGLAIGSADLIGSLNVTFVHRRHHLARALAIEVKQPGKKPTAEQRTWLDHVIGHGWLAGVCTSVAEAVALVEGGRRWER